MLLELLAFPEVLLFVVVPLVTVLFVGVLLLILVLLLRFWATLRFGFVCVVLRLVTVLLFGVRVTSLLVTVVLLGVRVTDLCVTEVPLLDLPTSAVLLVVVLLRTSLCLALLLLPTELLFPRCATALLERVTDLLSVTALLFLPERSLLRRWLSRTATRLSFL